MREAHGLAAKSKDPDTLPIVREVLIKAPVHPRVP